ncbi:transposase [Salmonella enterica]|nr:transposase [Salmonella enterica]
MFHTIVSIKNDGHYFCRAGGNRPDGLNEPVTYPTDIRKVIYTTNAIESLNSVIRHAIKKRKVFPTDDSVKKVVWLAIQSASQKWTMPLKDWRMAMSRFIIEFGDRLDGHF